ncbi:glucose 1-dehydrogenase [Acidiplasma aeolicum]|jgi:glucose 1-dehydrogenase|uniref:glucose 1-dehydrogenase n=1 Tax=Acidiplasma aeolicum TaxID=507754 RepID=UPI0037221017
MKNINLTNKVALITGASGGIGRSIAMALADAGASVAVHYSSNLQNALDVVNAIKSNGGNAKEFNADVSSPESVEKLFNDVDSTFGRLDILVNSAGIDGVRQNIGDDDINSWQKVININLLGPYYCMRQALKRMQKNHGGVIINITSDHVVIPWSGYSAYCSSKAGLDMLTKTAAQENADKGIRIVSIAPGAIKTNINKSVWQNPETLKDLNGKIAMGYAGSADDVANAVLYLASDMASYVTGITLTVDGGMLIYPDFRHDG